MPKRSLCNCPAYSYPHRKGSGGCVWNKFHRTPRCHMCGHDCAIKNLDGAAVSECCNGIVIRKGEEVESH